MYLLPLAVSYSAEASRFFLCEFLVDIPNLLLDIDAVRVIQLARIFTISLPIIALEGRFLPPRQFLFSNGLPRYRIENVTPLAGKTLQVVCNISM